METRREKFLTMCSIQDEYCVALHPKWTQQNWPIQVAIQVEVSETISALQYKWWKAGEIDWDEVRLELVDIWHFVLEGLLVKAAEHKLDLAQLAITCVTPMAKIFDTPLDVCIALTEWNAFNITNDTYQVRQFLAICAACQLPFDELYRQYVAKNILNKFRQQHGYATGEYVKNWEGKDDNEVLAQLLRDGIDIMNLPHELSWRYNIAVQNKQK